MSTSVIFDALWARYDEWYERHRAIAESEARLVAHLLSDAPQPLIEVGVGTGYFAQKIGASAGLDPSINMLRVARKRGIPLLVAGVGERQPFRSSVFGSALIVVTLCFADSPEKLLKETYRVLRRGGVLVSCIVPADSSWGRYYANLGAKGHAFYSRARFLSRSEHEDLIARAGFLIEATMGVLRWKPWESEAVDEPGPAEGDVGFVCVKGVKP
ncbi:MAG: class I SAM-dependent methyltransferase [Aeropyrum sp.]|nr:class I SAM-dependent methyltransferase [Aeropyrum sp.]MCE4616636.1 class I SAM-dependent methyltransferase [Aeropyrum sp.]